MSLSAKTNALLALRYQGQQMAEHGAVGYWLDCAAGSISSDYHVQLLLKTCDEIAKQAAILREAIEPKQEAA